MLNINYIKQNFDQLCNKAQLSNNEKAVISYALFFKQNPDQVAKSVKDTRENVLRSFNSAKEKILKLN